MKTVVLFKSDSEDYRDAFSKHNYEPIFIEPLQFIYYDLEDLSTKLLSKDYDGIILTSPRAIEAVSKCWDPTKFVIWNTKRVYTVGDTSTHKIKLLLGLEALGATSGNAENLAKIIVNENAKQSKFIFPCGSLKSETLPNILQEHEIAVDSIMVYETKEHENLRSSLMELDSWEVQPCCLVFFSPSGCEYIHRQLQTFNNQLFPLPHFAIGNSTAHKIQILGIDIAGVANQPKADSLVESVQTYFETVKE